MARSLRSRKCSRRLGLIRFKTNRDQRQPGTYFQSKAASSFADDAAIAERALPYINAAFEAGLVQGQSLNKFNPLAPITRAEAVVLLARLASLQ
ncbi:S-layer homology domain-containing protein [Cohnella sp. GCM10020058]|uniref:S-layer homology domain-containing protein n=1 Tax=Cohnella sp. GCM10020058 TaxID=3317330 RepID=UPI00363F2786